MYDRTEGVDNRRVTGLWAHPATVAQQMIVVYAQTLRGPSGGHCVGLSGRAKPEVTK